MTKQESTSIARRVLADNVRRRRLAMDLSQEVLAELVGLHRTYVSHVENCLSNITLDNIERLALFFGIHPYLLLKPSRGPRPATKRRARRTAESAAKTP